MVDRLASVVAAGGPAATNLGRLAGTVSAQLGFREAGTTAAADSARSYLGGASQDPDLLAAETSLGFGRGAGAQPTANGLRSAGQTLGRQAHSAFEAIATAADVNKGNPALLPNVISHQLGPMPRLLDGFISGCTAVVPAPSLASIPATGGGSGSGSGSGVGTNGAEAGRPLSNKRMKEECDDGEDGRPEKKAAYGSERDTKSGLPFPSATGGAVTSGVFAGGNDSKDAVAAVGKSAAGATAAAAAGSGSGSENGRGASSSPATAAPPAPSNLLARPASADFHHGGGGQLLALIQAKVGRLFSLDAEYTHVRMGAVPLNGTPAARGGGEGIKLEEASANGGGATASAAASAGEAPVEDAAKRTSGLRRVLARLKAVRAGRFVVHIKFDVAGKNECRPCDVSVLSWNEAQENVGGAGGGGAAGGADVCVKAEATQERATGSFVSAVDGSKPWQKSQHTAFVRVSGHAFKVGIGRCLVVYVYVCVFWGVFSRINRRFL